jgi:hypothetical protein
LGLAEPQLNGSEIRFVMPQGSSRARFQGRVNGDRMEGTANFGDGKVLRWQATRVKG